MVGQAYVSVTLEKMVERNRVPSGMLFVGTRGTGKTSAARILAQALNCTSDETTKPCGGCEACLSISQKQSLSVIEVDAASNGSVADVRTLISSLQYNVGGTNRVVILDEAHSMSREAFNALLLTLEEPPENTVFILITTEPDKIPGTIKSRTIEFAFKKVTPADIFNRLIWIAEQESFSTPTEVLQFIANRADGSLRDAVMNLDLAERAGIASIEEYRQLVGHYDLGPKLIALMADGDEGKIFQFVSASMEVVGDPHQVTSQLISTFRDLLVIKAGGDVELTGTALDIRKLVASKIEKALIFGALKLLWDVKTKIRVADDPRGSMELAIMLITELLSRGKQQEQQATPVAPSTPAPEKKKLTLAELQQQA